MPASDDHLKAADLIDASVVPSPGERCDGLRRLESEDAGRFFLGLRAAEQGDLLRVMNDGERRFWLRLLAPDDASDVLQLLDATMRVVRTCTSCTIGAKA